MRATQPLALARGQVNAVKKAIPKSIEAMRIAKRIRLLRMFRSMRVSSNQVSSKVEVEDFGKTKSVMSGFAIGRVILAVGLCAVNEPNFPIKILLNYPARARVPW